MKVLILGGYGTFGGRLARLLAEEPRLTLCIAGRSIRKAEAFCNTLPAGAGRRAELFDRAGDVAARIAALGPDLVVDASGPFQNYGADPYRVVKACIDQGVDYLDIADGAAFVKGIHQFDAAAKARGIVVLSGVSSCPVLTAAVTRRLSAGMATVERVSGGIAPSPYAGVGLNVLRAIASYAGKRVPLVRAGRQASATAITESRRYTIAPPGHLPLRNRRFCLVDVPDLQVLPELWPELQDIWIGAGTVPEILQRFFSGLAWLVRLRLVPSLEPLAPLFHAVSRRLRWGEHRGGMFVEIAGTDAAGRRIERSWHLIAEGDDGPFIPSMACAALVLKILEGKRPAPGARPASRDVELEDYESFFRTRRIFCGTRDSAATVAALPLYRRVLGDAWEHLPPEVRAMHHCREASSARGIAEVDRGAGLLSRLIDRLVGFPATGRHIPVSVEFHPDADGERWVRRFDGKVFSSVQTEGAGRAARMIRERFGPLLFDLAPVIRDERLDLVIRRWSLLGLPLPMALAPRCLAYECRVEGRFTFHVEISHPLTGLIVRYRGWLVPNQARLPIGDPTRA